MAMDDSPFVRDVFLTSRQPFTNELHRSEGHLTFSPLRHGRAGAAAKSMIKLAAQVYCICVSKGQFPWAVSIHREVVKNPIWTPRFT